jgi:hypothetical protein
MIGRHRLTFVPLNGATVAPSHVRVAYPKKQVKDGGRRPGGRRPGGPVIMSPDIR